MSAYATSPSPLRAVSAEPGSATAAAPELPLIDKLLSELAGRVAELVVAHLDAPTTRDGEWFDSRHAAEYLGVHRDTLRKLAAERSIPSEQDGPGCKLYFKRSDLDAWRHSGGQPRHLAVAQSAV